MRTEPGAERQQNVTLYLFFFAGAFVFFAGAA